jgi:hypothetical protein
MSSQEIEEVADVTPVEPAVVKKTKPVFIKLEDLDPNSANRGINVIVKVTTGELSRLINRTYLDGTKLEVSSLMVGDKTGQMELHLKNDQIGLVKKDDTLILRNCVVKIFDSRMFLKVDEWGKLETAAPEQYQETVGEENFSAIEWELVDN